MEHRTLDTLGPTVGHVHATSETELLNPAFLGSRLRLTGRIAGRTRFQAEIQLLAGLVRW